MAQRSKVGHYDIVAELGRGGMGVVYQGFEASLNRHVAIKMLSEALADDSMVVERFFREARSMAQLNDPHIVQIYLVGEDQGQPFFAMEFVEGESLSQRLKRERLLEPFEAARVLLQVAQGLAAAHDRGVVHRDIKPANLLITQRGVVKVADFGIALASQDFNKKLTGTGQFVGTPGYLSPEVCLGKPVDQRSDIFALGIVFFEMLTGQTPFKDESPLGMMLEVVQAEIPDVRRINESVDPRFAEVLRRMVAKDPAERYPDCHQLIADLVAIGVNAATPVAPARSAAHLAVGTAVNVPTPPEMRRLATPAPVAAVVPGYSTVASGERAIPAPAPAPAPAPVAVAAAVAVAAQPRLAQVETRKGSALPWAAAVAALLIGGGSAAYYLGGINGKPAAATAVPATNTVAVVPTAAPPVATPASAPPPPPPTTAAAAVTNADPSAPSAPATTSPAVADAASTANATAMTDPQPAVAAAPTAPSVPSPAEAAPTAMVAAEAAPDVAPAEPANTGSSRPTPYAGAPASTPNPQSAAIGARLADLREQRRDRREAHVAGAAQKLQLAKANPAPVESAPAYRGPPRVMVLAFGDAAVAGSAELAIEERLGESGLNVVDEDLVPGLSGVENGNADMARLVAAAGRHADFVVAIRVVPIGQQELTFYGESMTQYTARVDVGAYDVQRRSKIGAGWNAQVSFTHLNADPNTRAAIAPYLSRIAQNLGEKGRG